MILYTKEDMIITSTVWIEIKLPKYKNILLSSIYRQWSTPKQLHISNSHEMNKQIKRWEMVINKWDTALKENKDKIIFMHCVSAYPCNPENVNFPRMEKLKK